jgi:hypothetical protein
MQCVLHTMHDLRRGLALDLEQCLHAQQAGAGQRRPVGQPGVEAGARDGLREAEAVGTHIVPAVWRQRRAEVRCPCRERRQQRAVDRFGLQIELRSKGIDLCERAAQRRKRFGARQIRLADEQPVGSGNLAQRFGLRDEIVGAMAGIDQRQRAGEAITRADAFVVDQRSQQRRRVSQTRGFDHHAFELAAAGARKAPVRIAQGLGKVAAQGTADAAAGQFDHGLLCRVAHQQMVERCVTVFVDDDQRIGHVRLRQKAVEQRGLAAAQETGQQHHWNMCRRHRCTPSSRA